MASTRLPGKVLLPVGGVPVIEHVVRRCAATGYSTIILPPRQSLAWLAEPFDRMRDVGALRACVFGYHEDLTPIAESDVLGRFAAYCRDGDTDADYIVRITGDCPFIDPDLIREVTEATMAGGYEYGDNITFRSYPRGLDVQVYRRDYLQWLHEVADTPEDREHVLPRFTVSHTRYCRINPAGDASHHRWCLDTPRDYAWFQTIAQQIDCTPPHPPTRKLIDFLEAHPEYAHTDDPATA